VSLHAEKRRRCWFQIKPAPLSRRRAKGTGEHTERLGLTRRVLDGADGRRKNRRHEPPNGWSIKRKHFWPCYPTRTVFLPPAGQSAKYERSPISGTVRVTYPGHSVVQKCSCADISPRGIAIDCPDSMLPGALIALHAEEQSLSRLARAGLLPGALHRVSSRLRGYSRRWQGN
jgi:hypothetical protein